MRSAFSRSAPLGSAAPPDKHRTIGCFLGHKKANGFFKNPKKPIMIMIMIMILIMVMVMVMIMIMIMVRKRIMI